MKNKLLFTRSLALVAIVVLLMMPGLGWGQQVIGEFPNQDGGFESQTAGALGIVSSTTIWWLSASITGSVVATGGRSGPKYANISESGATHRTLRGPAAASIAATTNYTTQFYFKGDKNADASADYGDIRGGVSGNTFQYGTYVTNQNQSSWTKYAATTGTNPGASTTGCAVVSIIEIAAKIADFDIDDVVIYAGAVDNTLPNVPGGATATVNSPTTSSLNVSWTAASGGVDGGGYVVVRYASNPYGDNDPNQNGIYSIGNTTTNGTGSLTGTVRYIGTEISFTDNVGLSEVTQYWYKVYTVDKAFNYSAEIQGNGTTSSASSPVLGISGTTSHGSSCPTIAATPVQYTITNTGPVQADGITVVSSGTNAADFVVSGLSSTSIAATSGTATYYVTFTPSSSGARTATITVASTTSGSNSPLSSLTGTGTTVVVQAVTSSAASSVTAQLATLNGNFTTAGVCPATIEKGFVYSKYADNSDPIAGGTGVTKTSVSGVITGAYTLPLTSLASSTQYSFKAYVYNGTAYTYSSPVLTFTTSIALTITGTTNNGTVCPGVAATPQTYTITNNGAVSVGGIAVGSSDAQFVVSAPSSATIAAGGTATYTVTFTPSSAGAKSATVTVSSTTSGIVSATSTPTGTGTTVVTPVVNATTGATLPTAQGATLNGNVTTVGICPTLNEKGFVYSVTATNSNPLVGGTGVTKTSVGTSTIATGAYTLVLTGLPSSTGYTYKSYVYDGSAYTYSSTAPTFSTTIALTISGTTNNGPVCPGVAATPQTYTITNNGAVSVGGIAVGSSDAQFVASAPSSTTIAAGSTATYTVTFTPSSAGAKSATVTVSSTTSGIVSATSTPTGTGTTPVTPAVSSSAASTVVNTTARLNGNVTTLGVCPSTTAKGFVYSKTSDNADPIAGQSGVTTTPVSGLATGAYYLDLSSLSPGTEYKFKAYLYDGATYTYSSLTTYTTLTTATKLAFGTAPPSTGSVGINLTTFTVQAQRADNTVDVEYTGNITVAKVTGAGNISGTLVVAPSAGTGTATFSAVQFDAIDTYTIKATSVGLTDAPTSGNIVVTLANSNVDSWINIAAPTAWHTNANWSTNAIPATTEVAQWNNTGSATTCTINISTGAPTLLGIEITSSRTRVLTFSNSVATAGVITLNGGVINSTSNVILRNASASALTFTNGSALMGIALGNATNNLVNTDGTGGIIINSIISGSGKNLTKAGSEVTGLLTLGSAANTYSGTTTITTGELRLNPSSTTATFVSQIVLNGGTLSTTNIAANTVLTSSATLKLDATSTIALGAASHSLKFAASDAITWNGTTLTVTGWTGTAGATGVTGKIYFGTSASGLTAGQLAKIKFTGYDGGATILAGTGEVVPLGAASIQYRSKQVGDWNVAATWEYSIDGTNWFAASNTPGSANGVINIRSGHTVTVTASVAIDQTTINSGGTVILSGGTLTVDNGADANDLVIQGTYKRTASASTITTTGVVYCDNGGTYEHAVDGGSIPTITWNAGSTFLVTGFTSTANFASGLNQSFGNVTWNCTGQGIDCSFGASLTTVNGNFTVQSTGTSTVYLLLLTNSTAVTTNVAGNFEMQGGKFAIGSANATGNCILNVTGNCSISGGIFDIFRASGYTGTFNLGGNFSMSGGTFTKTAGTANVVFDKTGTQTYTKSAGTISGAVNFTVNSGSIFDMGTSVLDGSTGTFTLSSGATLKTANATGITGSVTVSGTETFSSGANYEFKGAATGTFTTTPTANTVNDLTINNAAGVSLGQNITVNGILSLTSGLLTPGSNTITIAAAGAVSNAGSSSYVNGKLVRVFGANGSKDFAIGKGGFYRPVSLNYTALSGTSTVTAEQFETTIPGSTPTNTTLSGTRYWVVSESGSASRTFNVTLDGTGFSPTHTVKMINGNGTTNTAYAVTAPDYTATGFTSYSNGNFGLGEEMTATTTTPDDKTVCLGSTSVYLTATVSPAFSGGTVQFFIDGSTVGSPVAVSTGVATHTYNPGALSAGAHAIRADFLGFADYLASTSNPANNKTLTVNALPATVTISNAGPNCTNTTLNASNGSSGTIYFQGTTSGGTSTTTASASEVVSASGTYYFRAQSSAGCWGTEGSAVVTIGTSVTPAVSIAVNVNPVVAGNSVLFTPTPVNGGTPIYEWFNNNVSHGTGVVYSCVPSDNDHVYVIMASSLTCATSSTATSDEIIMIVTVAPATSIWNGSISNNWHTHGNWSNGIPGTTTDVTIPAGLSTYPTMSSTGACTDIFIGSSAAGTASLLDNGYLPISGTVTMEHYMTTDTYHSFSPSVSGTSANIFHLPGSTGLDVYLYSHSETDNANSTNGYFEISDINTSLVQMAGYSVYPDGVNATPPQSAWTIAEQGGLNTGSFGSANNMTRTGGGTFAGFNYVGNPYPSSIDWNAASDWTKTNVNNAIYIEENMGWAAYVAGVGTGSPVAGSRYISPGQGFFVEASSSLGTLIMNNRVRVNNSAPYLKNTINNLVRLQVSGNGYNDDAVVRFLPEATSAFDGEYDAHKLFGNVAEAAQLYSMGTTALAINSLQETNQIPLGLHVGTESVYTIAATEINDLSAVTLEDTKTGIFTDLSKDSYSFSFTPGENEQRFVLHFGALSVNNVENSFANIYSNSRTVYVDLKDNAKGDIFIYNISGQLVASKPSAMGMNRINLANTGNYIVKVITRQRTMVKMVFIR